MYFSSSENIKGSILTLCLRLASAVNAGLLPKLCILFVPVLFFNPPSDLIKKFLTCSPALVYTFVSVLDVKEGLISQN